MLIAAIAWLYVALMMAVAEATSLDGTVVGAVMTFIGYGVLPVGLLLYILGTPARKRALRAREQAARDAQANEQMKKAQAPTGSIEPDAGGQASADAVAPERKED